MSAQLDELDRDIIRILQENGRIANVEIARRLGVAEGTIRKRLDRLLDEGWVRLAVALDLPRAGYPHHVFIGVQCEPQSVSRIAGALRRESAVIALYFVAGEWNLLIEAAFDGPRALTYFLLHTLGQQSGILRTTVLQVLETIRSPADWRLPPARPSHILVVDDDPDFVEFCRTVLTHAGYRVSSAASGEQALAQMHLSRPDLVLLDVMMRDIWDGLHAAEEMRADQSLAGIPVVMVSSIADSPYAGMFPMDTSPAADAFLAKPIAPDRLVAEVRRLLAKRG